MGLTLGALVTNPVGFLVTEASELARVQTSQAFSLPVPKLHDLRLPFSKDRMALFRAMSLLDTVALRAILVFQCSVMDGCRPFMPKLTLPNGWLAAVGHNLV